MTWSLDTCPRTVRTVHTVRTVCMVRTVRGVPCVRACSPLFPWCAYRTELSSVCTYVLAYGCSDRGGRLRMVHTKLETKHARAYVRTNICAYVFWSTVKVRSYRTPNICHVLLHYFCPILYKIVHKFKQPSCSMNKLLACLPCTYTLNARACIAANSAVVG